MQNFDTPALTAPHLSVAIETWPVAGTFRISRSSLSEITVVTATITDGGHRGRGECRPYARYDETPQSVAAQIESLGAELGSLTAQTLLRRLPAGAARNAVDCALWDLAVQKTRTPITELLDLPAPKTRQTAFTLSIDTPENMRIAALAAKQHKLLKIKIGGEDGLDSCLAVMDARADAELIIDANEALTSKACARFQKTLCGYPVLMIEQPVPAGQPLPNMTAGQLPIICADESLHTRQDLKALWGAGYRAVNVKLDKSGGLTEGYALLREARAMGFVIMLGCMVGTSLAMAPAMYLSSYADVIDLDGALLLAKDRKVAMGYESGMILPPPARLWGMPR